jgi:hypothetical protein
MASTYRRCIDGIDVVSAFLAVTGVVIVTKPDFIFQTAQAQA